MKRKWVVIVGGLVMAGMISAAAFAAETNKGNSGTAAASMENCMDMAAMCKNMMDQHMKDGKMTKEQCDKMKDNMSCMKDMQGNMDGMMDGKSGKKMCCGGMNQDNTKQNDQKN